MADKLSYLDIAKLQAPKGSGIDAITKDTPTGPLASPKLVRGEDGLMHTVYIDAKTGETLDSLNGYTILDGNNYYKVTGAEDINKDGSVDTNEVTNTVKALGHTPGTGSTREDAQGHTPGPKATFSNNFGYKEKPGMLGLAGKIAGLVNPGVGAAIGVLGKAYNVGNMEASNAARKALGLSPLTGGQMVKGALKDTKGQVARVDIGDNKYSIGLDAMDDQGRTNMTPAEASRRAQLSKNTITETDDPKVKATEESPQAPKGMISKALTSIGLEKGFATKALNSLTGTLSLPGTAPTPTQSPTARPEDMGAVTPGAAQSTKARTAPAAGLVSHPNNPTPNPNTARNPDDALGRVSIDKVNFDKVGLNPAMAAKMKDFQKEAIDQGLKLSVDVGSLKRTPEQQAAIMDAGFSKTKVSYHNIGLAVDVSPTAIDDKGRIIDQATLDKSRALAKSYGFGLLDPSWDPAHIQQTVPGETAASLAKRQVDAWGNIKLSPEEDLGIRENSVPTPSTKPTTTTGFVSQDERSLSTGNIANAATTVSAPEADRNYTGQGVTPSKAFASQDEKANTGNVKNAVSGFVSQDERSSLAERTGITDAVGDSLDPGQNVSKVTGNPNAQQSIGAQTVANSVQSSSAKLGTSPAARAAMGFTNRTVAEKTAMARAIAGELSQGSLKGLKARDPAAMAELGNMVASMENRAASKTYTGINQTLNPTQYNSLMASNQAVTNQNYAQNKKALDQAMAAYYSGAIPGVNYSATSYYNPDVANPAWGSQLADPTKVGAHVFGSLPEYGEDAASKAAAKAMGLMTGTDFSPGKAKDDSIGYSGVGTSFGGSPGQSSGAGYSSGGMNSPSGSGFGGVSGNYGGSGNSSTGGGSGYGGGSAGGGTASGGGAGMSGGGGYSPGGMGSPSGSSAGSSSPSAGGSMGGLGGPTSNNSGNSGGNKAGGSVGKGGGYSSGASKGSTGGL